MWNHIDGTSRSQTGASSFNLKSPDDMDSFHESNEQTLRQANDDCDSATLKQGWTNSRNWSMQYPLEGVDGLGVGNKRSNDPHSFGEPLLFDNELNVSHGIAQASPGSRLSISMNSGDPRASHFSADSKWSSDQSGAQDRLSKISFSAQGKDCDDQGRSLSSHGVGSMHGISLNNASGSNQETGHYMFGSPVPMSHAAGARNVEPSSLSRMGNSLISSVPYIGNPALSYPSSNNSNAVDSDMMRWHTSSLPSLGFHMNQQADQNRQLMSSTSMPHIQFQQQVPYLPGGTYPDQPDVMGFHGLSQVRNIPGTNMFQLRSASGRHPNWNEQFTALPGADDAESFAPPSKIHRREGSAPGLMFSKNSGPYSPLQETMLPTLNGFPVGNGPFGVRQSFSTDKMHDVSHERNMDRISRAFQNGSNSAEGLGALVAAGAHVEGVPSQNGPLAPPPVSIENSRMYAGVGVSQGSGPASKGYSTDCSSATEGFMTSQNGQTALPMDIDCSNQFGRRANQNDLTIWHNLADQSRRASAVMMDGRKNGSDQIPDFWMQHKMGVSALENSVFQGNISAPTTADSSSGEKDFVERYDPSIWSYEEGMRLKRLVEVYGTSRWSEVARNLPGKSETQCLLHWRYTLNEDQQVRGIGSWSVEEDARLKALVELQGTKWAMVARHMPGRVAKQCRERYLNHLDPALHRGPWSEEEEQQLLRLCEGSNRQWAEICRQLPGRSYNDVKNRYNLIQRRLRRMQRTTKEVQSASENGQHNSSSPVKNELELKIDYSTASPSSQSQPSAEDPPKCNRAMVVADMHEASGNLEN